MEGPDWKKYAAKSSYYSHSSDIDYLMLKPSAAFGRRSPLTKSAYMSAMHYSGTWVIVAILSILLGIETFLTHIKVYCGIESVSMQFQDTRILVDFGKGCKAANCAQLQNCMLELSCMFTLV